MAAAPIVLVADDDPVARRFFADALAGLGFAVVEAADTGAARARLDAGVALAIADVRMPGGGAQALRADAAACGVPLVAMSGEPPAGLTGFADVWPKPVALDALREAIARFGLLVLDDAAALRATGSRAALDGLRALLARELPGQLDRIARARGARDDAAIGAELHKLRAACGFCGLAALGAAVAALQRGEDAWDAFDARARRALEAIRD